MAKRTKQDLQSTILLLAVYSPDLDQVATPNSRWSSITDDDVEGQWTTAEFRSRALDGTTVSDCEVAIRRSEEDRAI